MNASKGKRSQDTLPSPVGTYGSQAKLSGAQTSQQDHYAMDQAIATGGGFNRSREVDYKPVK